MSSKFDGFVEKYNKDQVQLSDTLARIDTKLEGIDTFKKATIEHAIKIKNSEFAISANHKRIKGVYTRMWAFVCSLVLALVGGIFGMVKYLKHGG